ncbi:MAG: CPBP family intramembrane metalloprotease [Clostridia bacterium]|nr:CPBP family intramembrane metalloprotease [Clostridia bacterium]
MLNVAKKATVYLLPNIVCIAVTGVELILGIRTYGGFTKQVITISLMAGIFEEIIFRALPLTYVMRKKPSGKTISVGVAVTSVVFGAAHLANIAGGVVPTVAVYQATAAACLGVLYAAVFLRTKSVLPAILAHFTNDVVGLLDSGSTANGLMTNITLTKLDYIDIAFAAVYLIVGIYLIRPAKHKEILELWKKDEEQND